VKITSKTDQSTNILISVGDFKVGDSRPGAMAPDVAGRWLDQCDRSVNQPIVRVQANQGAPVCGITVFHHIEINLDPTMVMYDVTFFNMLIDFLLHDNMRLPVFTTARCEIHRVKYSLPDILVPPGLLPKVTDVLRDILDHKAVEYVIKVDRAEANFLLRYFKITGTRLNVSYYNPENKIVQQITEFNGLLHDVIFQDFNATMKTFIDQLVSQISSDVLPQFFKHLIGLGKLSSTKDTELQMWLSNDHDKATERKKELLFGKQTKR
jgi:hypothetical protein